MTAGGILGNSPGSPISQHDDLRQEGWDPDTSHCHDVALRMPKFVPGWSGSLYSQHGRELGGGYRDCVDRVLSSHSPLSYPPHVKVWLLGCPWGAKGVY